MALILNISDGNGLQPTIFAALASYGGPLFNTEHGLPHPIGMLNNSWSAVEKSALDFLNKMDEMRARPRRMIARKGDAETINIEEDVISKYENFIYESVEFIEDADSNLRLCLLPKGQYSQWSPVGIRGIRKHADMICNKLKHEHNRMIRVSIEHNLGRVDGYSVCAFDSDSTLRPNQNIHSYSEVFSYSLDMKRIMANIYIICDSISQEIERIGYSYYSVKRQIDFSGSKTIEVIRRVSQLSPLVFMDEGERQMPIFKFDEETLKIERRGGFCIHPISGSVSVTSSFTGDGTTRSYHLFGKKHG